MSAFGVHPVVGRVGIMNHPKGQRPHGTDGPEGRGSGVRQSSGRGKPPGSSKGRGKPPGSAKDRRKVIESPRDWGGVARRGAGHLVREDREDRGARAGRTAERAHRAAERSQRPTSPVREHADRLHAEAAEAVSRSGQVVRNRRPSKAHNREPLPRTPLRLPDADTVLRRVLGDGPGGRAAARLREAARAFEDERFGEARRILNPLVERAPHVAEVVELLGLTHYRMGHWRAAAHRLEDFRRITGGTEQHPVLADCYRAQGRWSDVDELWSELRASSPGASLVTEGRLVTAGALADRGRLADAIQLLERGWSVPRRPRDHHLRRAYALADLYERSGAVPRARQLFGWLDRNAPGFADTTDRLRALG